MRVFKDYGFNLKQRVLYKDTMDFTEQFLSERNILYENIGFALIKGSVEKCVDKYPSLKKYYLDGEMSSIPSNWPAGNIHVDKSDEETIRALIRKVPRPFSFWASTFFLDNVHWFDTINTIPATYNVKRPNAYGFGFQLSNNIRFIKHFDTGRKLNLVSATIEVTNTDDCLLDDSSVLELLTSYLQKPYARSMIVAFNEQENIEKEKAIAKTKHIIDRIHSAFLEAAEKPGTGNIYQGLTGLASLSPKQVFSKVGKKWGYTYKGYGCFIYTIRKINKNNHCFDLLAFVERDKTLGCIFELKGINFAYSINMGKVLTTSETQLEDGINKMFQKVGKVESELEDILLENHGKSPVWLEY